MASVLEQKARAYLARFLFSAWALSVDEAAHALPISVHIFSTVRGTHYIPSIFRSVC